MKNLLYAMALVCALPLHALAQEEDPEQARAATFQAAEGAQAEDIPGGPLMIAAYAVAWLLVLGFVGSIALRQARAASALAQLKKEIDQRAELDDAREARGLGWERDPALPVAREGASKPPPEERKEDEG